MMRIIVVLLFFFLGGFKGVFLEYVVVESFPLSSSSTRRFGALSSPSSSTSLSFLRSRIYDDKKQNLDLNIWSTTTTTTRSSLSSRDHRTSFGTSSLSSRSSTSLFGTKRMAAASKVSSATGVTAMIATIWAKLLSVLGSLTTFLTDIIQWQNWLPKQKLILAIVFMIGIFVGKNLPSMQFERFVNAIDIPTNYFGPNAPLLIGRVVSISDGDTFRFYHRPTIWHSTKFETKGPNKQKLSETTMPIRICTYDSPETPKFGKSGQAYGEEAKERLESLLMKNGSIIKIRLLQKDQYGRAVAQVFSSKGSKGVDEILLSEGLGEVYVGSGAVYGPLGKDSYLKIQQKAQKSKVGMWSLGKKRESAADYKRRTK